MTRAGTEFGGLERRGQKYGLGEEASVALIKTVRKKMKQLIRKVKLG